jgi:hypothetical protein
MSVPYTVCILSNTDVSSWLRGHANSGQIPEEKPCLSEILQLWLLKIRRIISGFQGGLKAVLSKHRVQPSCINDIVVLNFTDNRNYVIMGRLPPHSPIFDSEHLATRFSKLSSENRAKKLWPKPVTAQQPLVLTHLALDLTYHETTS